MGISLKTTKILWGRAGGKCAICKEILVSDSPDVKDDPSIIGEMAHIVAQKETFTRGDYESLTPEQRDHYSNLILLCRNDHKIIDDQPLFYTVEKLRDIKEEHEQNIKSDKSFNIKKQEDDEIYASNIDEWVIRSDLDNWDNISYRINQPTPNIPKQWYESSNELIPWICNRIWSNRYKPLEDAFFNYKTVLKDFIYIFSKHIDWKWPSQDTLITKEFYRIDNWDTKLYNELLEKFEYHCFFVGDLFSELTCAANYLCDHIRKYIFPGFRLKEGILMIIRGDIVLPSNQMLVRAEYTVNERTMKPYPGLDKFKEVRYTRVYAIDPNTPKLPFDDEDKT